MTARVLFLGGHDWANLSHRIARALNASAGEVVARVCVTNAHPYGYAEDVILPTADPDAWDELAAFAARADWAISTGDGAYGTFLEMARQLAPQARLATAHCGTAYRRDPAGYDEADREIGFRVRFVACDLWRHCRQDPKVVPYFGTADVAADIPPDGACLVVSHSPSNRAAKGTGTLLPVLLDLQAAGWLELRLIEGVAPAQAAALRRGVHVHVDQMNPEVGGFGQSAIEAVGNGSIVVADMRHVDPDVWKAFGGRKIPAEDVDTPERLRGRLRMLSTAHRMGGLRSRFRASLEWARATASPEAVARHWETALERFGG